VVAWVAVSSQSFWIDETQTALKAAAPTLHAWWGALYAEHNSNLQLPLYMVYIWGWARLFGVSELSLRGANVPWFFLGFFAVSHFLRRRPGLRTAALLVYCIHPFVWYYLNEARPYMLQLSGAMLVAGALFAALDPPEEPLPAAWWWLFGAGFFILCGSGLLGVPWAAAALVLLVCLRPGFLGSAFHSGRAAILVFVPLLAVLALYFGWTLMQGARPGETGMSFSSIPFSLYEHLGFVGLGPGRSDLRSRGFGVFLPYLPSLFLLGLPLMYALFCAAVVRFGLSARKFTCVFLAVLIPAAFVFTLGFTKHFLVLGRHLTPLFPFVLGALAFSIAHLWLRRGLLDRAVAALIVIMLTISALECRFAWRHQRDDNRGASAIAKAALEHGESVWWVADDASASFYGLPISRSSVPGSALALWNPVPVQLSALQPPALIVLSKPDLFDARAGARDYLKLHGYKQVQAVPAFTFWQK
jgi:hypothetical protein